MRSQTLRRLKTTGAKELCLMGKDASVRHFTMVYVILVMTLGLGINQ